MKRGEIWTLRDNGYASKARPVVIVQSNEIDAFDSVVLCLFTTFETVDIPTRVKVCPASINGLSRPSFVMTEKIVTVDKSMLGKRIGELDTATMHEVGRQHAFVLGIAANMVDE